MTNTWVRYGGLAFLALAVLKSIALALSIEQSTLSQNLLLTEIALVAVSLLVAWNAYRGKSNWLLIGIVAYVAEIIVFAMTDGKTLIDGFFLKVGVLATAVYGWFQGREDA